MATDISKSKTEFLKRYMENESKPKRKKKSRPSSLLVPRIKIVDENIDVKSIKFGDEVQEDNDEAPVVAEVIDDRPEEMKVKELYQSSRWKKFNSFEAGHDSIENIQQKVNKNHKHLHQSPSKRHDSDSDCSSPKRENTSKSHKQNTSRSQHDSDSDNSPPRLTSSSRRAHDSDNDTNPPRKRYEQSLKRPDTSTSRKGTCNESDSNLSPLRNSRSVTSQREGQRNSDSDLSPPRNSIKKDEKERSLKTLSGLKAGLQNATSLREETKDLREREKMHMAKLDADLSGRNAGTILRDRKTGKKRDLEEENRVKEEKEKKIAEQQQKYSEWGKGIEQTASMKDRFVKDLYEMSKPLARYCDDEDLDEQLRSMIHADDPMADYMRKKQKEKVCLMPEYKGPPPPPNRFGIRPGYRWDGVDRSNGFEKKYFEKLSSSKAKEEEAYLWSVQDM